MMEKENNKPKSKRAKVLLIIIWVLLGLVLLLVLSGLFMQTSRGGKLVLRKAGKILEEKTGLILTAECLSLNPF